MYCCGYQRLAAKESARDPKVACDPPGGNFINIKRTNFSYERHFVSFYYVHVTRKKLPKPKFVRKIRAFTNVDEIDGRG